MDKQYGIHGPVRSLSIPAILLGLIPVPVYGLILYLHGDGPDAYLAFPLYAIGMMVFAVPLFLVLWYFVLKLLFNFDNIEQSRGTHLGIIFLLNEGLLFAGCSFYA